MTKKIKPLIVDTGDPAKDSYVETLLEDVQEKLGITREELSQKFLEAIRSHTENGTAKIVTLDEYAQTKATLTGATLEECLADIKARQHTLH